MSDNSPASTPSSRQLLRHGLATVAYRAGKALRGVPAGFADFRASESSRSPVEILAHMGDIFDWALTLAQGAQKWNVANPQPWERECARFFAALEALDAYLASGEPLGCSPEKLLQAPIADALTHVGQIAMLRRIAGGPMRGENYFVAEIVAGRVGGDQTAPKFEFD
jgi:hypothetical protein